MHHLQIPERLQDQIDYRYYQSGHMVYALQESLKAMDGQTLECENATAF